MQDGTEMVETTKFKDTVNRDDDGMFFKMLKRMRPLKKTRPKKNKTHAKHKTKTVQTSGEKRGPVFKNAYLT